MSNSGKMVVYTVEIGVMAWSRVKVVSYILMGIYTKDNGRMEKLTDMEHFTIQMELVIKVIGRTICSMVTA